MISVVQKCTVSLVGFIAFIELGFALPVIMIDLSYNYDEKTQIFPGHVPFESRNRRSVPVNKNLAFQTAELFSSEHAGTHMDAPYHFNKLKQTMEEVPLELFEGPGVVIDIREKASNNSDAEVEMEDIEKWEKTNGPIPKGSMVFMNSGWQQYAHNRTLFSGMIPNETFPLHYPGFHIDACRFLILTRGIRTIGTDTLSFDYGQTRDFPCHRLLAEVSGVGLENLANLDKLPATGSFIKAYPMKIKGGSGAPCRVIASIAQPKAATSK